MTLPTDDKARKALPIWDGVIMYWPDVWAEIAKVSKAGNDQHNPGQPLHWAREKSTDQMNTAFRHMLDRGAGEHFNVVSGVKVRHLAQAIWRLCAQLQLDLEAENYKPAKSVRSQTEAPKEYDVPCKCTAVMFTVRPGDAPPYFMADSGKYHSTTFCGLEESTHR